MLIYISWVINVLYIRGRDRIKSAENLVIAININRIPLINEDLVFLYKLLILLLLLSNKLSNKSFGNRSRWGVRS